MGSVSKPLQRKQGRAHLEERRRAHIRRGENAQRSNCQHLRTPSHKSQAQGRGGGGKGIEKRSKKLEHGVITVPFRQMNPYDLSTTTD